MDECSSSKWFLGFDVKFMDLKMVLFFCLMLMLFCFWSMPLLCAAEQSASESIKTVKLAAVSGVKIKPVHKSKSDAFNLAVLKAADRYDVDAALIKAVIMAESGYNPTAVSRQGAKGLMQLMPRTARALGVKDAFNPVHNINGGVKYLRQLLNAFDENIRLALAAYNAGTSKVKRHRGIPPIKATRHYVKKVIAYYQHYKKEMAEKTGNA